MTNKNIEYYIALPYTRTLTKDDDGDVVATVSELPGCVAHGESDAEALSFLAEMMRAWLQARLESGKPVPEPATDSADALPSGRWLQRVPRSLHAGLIELAKREDTSLNQLVTTMLAEGITRMRAISDFKSRDLDWTPHLRVLELARFGAAFHQTRYGAEQWSLEGATIDAGMATRALNLDRVDTVLKDTKMTWAEIPMGRC